MHRNAGWEGTRGTSAVGWDRVANVTAGWGWVAAGLHCGAGRWNQGQTDRLR
jgi:hypothetical protein